MSRILLAALLLGAGITPALAQTAPPAAATDCTTRAQSILRSLKAGDYDKAGAHFDERMRQAVPSDKLEQLWATVLPAQAGQLEHAENPQSRDIGNGTTVVTVPLKFSKAWIDLQVACSADNQVSGLFFRPGSAPESADPSAGLSDNEHPLAVKTPLGPLPGILVLPRSGKPPFPAVVLLAGSGSLDKDETIGPNKPLRDIAQGLAKHGIASLRYDKRTHAYGEKMAGKNISVDDEVTTDAVTAAHMLSVQRGIDPKRVFVLGHSLGALMAPRVGQRDPQLAGLILLAAPTRLDLDLVLRQTRYLLNLQNADQAKRDQALKPLIEARDTLAHADPDHPPSGQFFHAPASYWLGLMHYDAVDVASKLKMPMLILQGKRDYQVTMQDDFDKWKKAFAGNPRVTLRSFSGLSHLFMPAGDPPSPADYAKAGHVDQAVINQISQWIKTH